MRHEANPLASPTAQAGTVPGRAVRAFRAGRILHRAASGEIADREAGDQGPRAGGLDRADLRESVRAVGDRVRVPPLRSGFEGRVRIARRALRQRRVEFTLEPGPGRRCAQAERTPAEGRTAAGWPVQLHGHPRNAGKAAQERRQGVLLAQQHRAVRRRNRHRRPRRGCQARGYRDPPRHPLPVQPADAGRGEGHPVVLGERQRH